MMEKRPFEIGLGKNKTLVQQLREYQRNPRSLVFVGLAESYRKEGLADQALEILDEGLEFHPNLSGALVARAKCLFELKRYSDALLETKKILERNPENIRAHKVQSEIYLRLGQRNSAIRSLTHVLRLFPNDVEAQKSLQEIEILSRPQEIKIEAPKSISHFQNSSGKIEEFTVGSLVDHIHSIGEKSSANVSHYTPPVDPSGEERFHDHAFIPLAMEITAGDGSPEILANVSDVHDDSELTFATRTIAELYLRQGLRSKALKVLQKILRDEPSNQWARETLQDLATDEIVLPNSPKKVNKIDPLELKARKLERFLVEVQRMKHARGLMS